MSPIVFLLGLCTLVVSQSVTEQCCSIINDYRRQNGLITLQLSTTMTLISEIHVRNLQRYYFYNSECNSHSFYEDVDLIEPNFRFSSCCYTRTGAEAWCMNQKGNEITQFWPENQRYTGRSFENTAYGRYITPYQAVDLWRASPGHDRLLLLSSARACGAASLGSYLVLWIGDSIDKIPHGAPTPSPVPISPPPTRLPTFYPTLKPTPTPPRPTSSPSPFPFPSSSPSPFPSSSPSPFPSSSPSPFPSSFPSSSPSLAPSPMPSPFPSLAPSPMPSPFPSLAPTPFPSFSPTSSPTTPLPTPFPVDSSSTTTTPVPLTPTLISPPPTTLMPPSPQPETTSETTTQSPTPSPLPVIVIVPPPPPPIEQEPEAKTGLYVAGIIFLICFLIVCVYGIVRLVYYLNAREEREKQLVLPPTPSPRLGKEEEDVEKGATEFTETRRGRISKEAESLSSSQSSAVIDYRTVQAMARFEQVLQQMEKRTRER